LVRLDCWARHCFTPGPSDGADGGGVCDGATVLESRDGEGAVTGIEEPVWADDGRIGHGRGVDADVSTAETREQGNSYAWIAASCQGVRLSQITHESAKKRTHRDTQLQASQREKQSGRLRLLMRSD